MTFSRQRPTPTTQVVTWPWRLGPGRPEAKLHFTPGSPGGPAALAEAAGFRPSGTWRAVCENVSGGPLTVSSGPGCQDRLALAIGLKQSIRETPSW